MLRRWWAAFGRWRRSRPFWGGLSVLIGATIILIIPTAGSSIGVVFTEGIAGISGVLIALMLAVAGFTCWVSPAARVFAGIAACFLALVAVVTSNLGGFLFGTIFGVTGGAMAIAWTPDAVVKTPRGQKRVRRQAAAAGEPVLAGVTATPSSSAAVEGTLVPGTGQTARVAPPVAAPRPDAVFEPFPDATFSPPTTEVAPAAQDAVPDEIFREENRESRWGRRGRDQGGIGRVTAVLVALVALVVTPLASTATAGSRPAKQSPNDAVAQVYATAKNPTKISATYNQTGGTDYEGVGTYDGKRVLMFKFSSDDIQNMDMRSDNKDPNAPDVEIKATKAHLAGNMEFYATSLSGSLFGLVPATFTPDFPPPITLPTLILTNFSANVVFIKVDTMQLQGLSLTVVPPSS